MRILFISESDYNGGAARAMYRLNEALISAGAEVFIVAKYKTLPNNNIVRYEGSKIEKLHHRYNNFVIRSFIKAYDPDIAGFYYHNPFTNIMNYIKDINPDIIHIHWVTGNFIGYSLLNKIKIPVVWTFHDMRGFTGGCYFSGLCTNYCRKCGNCPKLNSGKEKDKSRKNYLNKWTQYKNYGKLKVVTPSNWMKNEALKSPLSETFSVECVPNCIDIEKYKPIEKTHARSILNLPLKKKLVLFGAAGGTCDSRKGFIYAKEAINKLTDNEIELLLFGPEEKPVTGSNKKIHYFHTLKDDVSIALLYAASDILLVPSVQENLANTIMESMACGTPAVAFNIGGNGEMILHKVNGILARPFSVEELSDGISYILGNSQHHEEMAYNARERIKELFNYNLIAGKHLKLYEELIH